MIFIDPNPQGESEAKDMQTLKCSEVWGGIQNQDIDVCSPGLNVSLFSSACDGGKGGDIYYLSLCSANRVTRIALADVMGHGEQISRISEWVYQQMATRLDDPDLPGMMADLNTRIIRRDYQSITTAVVLSFYRDLKHAYFCYAGHPPMLMRARLGSCQEMKIDIGEKTANLPFGVVDRAEYVMGNTPLQKNEIVLIYSDGVLEAPSPSGVLFGMNRLCSTVAEFGPGGADALKRGVIERLRDWTEGPLVHDDVTLMAIQVDDHWKQAIPD